MPAFCECGADKVICQECGRDVCSVENKTKWVEGKGNVCAGCQASAWASQHWSPHPGNTGYDLMC